MADSSQTKTEQPTTRRREEARKQGQVALSTELTGGALLLASVLVLSLAAPGIGAKLLELFGHQMRHFVYQDWTPVHTRQLAVVMSRYALSVVGGLLLGSLLAGLGVNLLQVGFRVSQEALVLKWSRLSPATGMQRIFSLRSVVRTLFGLTKLASVSVALLRIFV